MYISEILLFIGRKLSCKFEEFKERNNAINAFYGCIPI